MFLNYMLSCLASCLLLVPLGSPQAIPKEAGRETDASVEKRRGNAPVQQVEYISPPSKAIEYPSFQGFFEQELLPDTLDIAERARLGVHGLTSCVDPERDFEIYGWGFARNGQLYLGHGFHDYNGGQPKWIEDLPLLRSISGSQENIDVDPKMMVIFFRMLGPDGLYWIPVQGQVWSQVQDPYFDPNARQIFNSWPNGRALMALCAWYAHNQSPAFKQAIIRMVDGLASVAVHQKDYCWFREKRFDDRWIDEGRPFAHDATLNQSTIMLGLALAYRNTGYAPARALADRLSRFIRGPAKIIKPDGTYYSQLHFHGASMAMLGLLELALATHDDELLMLNKKTYEFARAQCDMTMGFVPEHYPRHHPLTEACQLAEMIIWGAQLSAAGAGDYWEDVEHLTRNQLAAYQLTDSGWLRQAAENSAPSTEPLPNGMTFDSIYERMIGTFSCFSAPNGQVRLPIMHCCTGNGNRAWYFVWKNIVSFNSGQLRVNLLLNRASPWGEVISYLPYRGQLDVKVHRPLRLEVRIPSWARSSLDSISCRVNEVVAPTKLDRGYLVVEGLKARDQVSVRFPLRREKIKVTACDLRYTLDIKGFNVVDIWPRDQPPVYAPFYVREDYRLDEPRFVWRNVFYPEAVVDYSGPQP